MIFKHFEFHKFWRPGSTYQDPWTTTPSRGGAKHSPYTPYISILSSDFKNLGIRNLALWNFRILELDCQNFEF